MKKQLKDVLGIEPTKHYKQTQTASSLYVNTFRSRLVISGSHFLRTYHGVSSFIYVIRLKYYVVLK
jgi:hypothetical protein